MSVSYPAVIGEDDIERLVGHFYGRIRVDPVLGPIFASRIPDDDDAWEAHMAHIASFWSSIFLKTKRFDGNPMAKHAGLQDLKPEHFTHWLEVFRDSAANTLAPDQAAAMYLMAERIAKSLQMGIAFNFEKAGQYDHPFSAFGLRSKA